MASDSDLLRELRDRIEISDLLLSYFIGLDNVDRDAAAGVYSVDARLVIDPEHVVIGRSKIREMLNNWPAPAGGQDVPWVERRVSHHIMGSPSVRVEGDEAFTETYALSHNVEGDPDNGGHVKVRALRYMDTLRRTQEGWRIVERLHTSDIDMSVTALYATTFDERVTKARWASGAQK